MEPTDDLPPQPLPVTGVLDLHQFRPQDVKEVVLAYLEECLGHGLFRVRIIHGKGIGALRATVHSLLEKDPRIISFALAPAEFGGWGATIVELRQPK